MTVSSSKTNLFPVKKECFPFKKYVQVEQLIFDYYYKKGYKKVGFENEPIADLFFYLCFEMFLLKPDWKKWDKNKSLKDYPQLLEFQPNKNKYLEKNNNDIPIKWWYSDICLRLNGNPLYFPNGVHYQFHRDKIDHFLDYKLPNANFSEVMKINYLRVIKMRKRYTTLFIWGGKNSIENMEYIVNNIPMKLLQYILRELFKNFYYNRIGFPDCWMWNEKKQHLKLVEVKRINEQIRPHQVRWLNKFFKNGIDVSVMRINFAK